jgi:hypothetical protein
VTFSAKIDSFVTFGGAPRAKYSLSRQKFYIMKPFVLPCDIDNATIVRYGVMDNEKGVVGAWSGFEN